MATIAPASTARRCCRSSSMPGRRPIPAGCRSAASRSSTCPTAICNMRSPGTGWPRRWPACSASGCGAGVRQRKPRRGLDRAGCQTSFRDCEHSEHHAQATRQTSADDQALPAARLLRRRRPGDPDRRAGAEEIRRAGLCPPRDRAQPLRRRRAAEARRGVHRGTRRDPGRASRSARSSFPRMACRNRCRPTRRRAICSISTPPARWSPRSTSRRCATSGSAAMCC